MKSFEPAADTIHARSAPAEIDETAVIKEVLWRRGPQLQLAKAAEEFSEAAAAIARFLAGEGDYTEIIAEVADTEIMCRQIRLIYGDDEIDQKRCEKVERLHRRLNNGRG